MKNFFLKTKTFAINHKKTSIIIGIVILFIGYKVFQSLTSTAGETSYMLGTVEKSTVVSSITGSGQVSSNHELDLKPKASANVVYIGAQEGATLHTGDLIVELDAADAEKAVRDARANLASAKIALAKVQAPSDAVTLLQAQNDYSQAQDDLTKAYNDSFTSISNAFLDLPGVVTGLNNLLYGSDFSAQGSNQLNISYYGDIAKQGKDGKGATYGADAESAYRTAKASYDTAFATFKQTTRSADPKDIQNLINTTYDSAQKIADALQSFQNIVQYDQDVFSTTNANNTINAKSSAHLTTVSGYISKVNTDVQNLLTMKNTLSSAIITVPEKQASLTKIQNGADPLDVQSAELTVTQRENALQDALDNLSDYYVRAPFNGTLAKLNVHRGDPASSSTAVATIIANDQVVDISLNEVDAAKVVTGDKVTLTFDAIDGLTLTGKVSTIDTVGTVTQGVVNYTATISFDTTDPRVKPGMSTTASIITAIHPDVLTVPSSAVKSNANGTYVQVFDTVPTKVSATTGGLLSDVAPKQITVTTGISDDTSTEIVTGLTEGQSIVTKTIAPSTTTSTSAPSLIGGQTGRAGGAAATRNSGR